MYIFIYLAYIYMYTFIYIHWAGYRRIRITKCAKLLRYIIAHIFGQLIRNIFLGHCESVLVNCESLFKWIRKNTFFWSSFLF